MADWSQPFSVEGVSLGLSRQDVLFRGGPPLKRQRRPWSLDSGLGYLPIAAVDVYGDYPDPAGRTLGEVWFDKSERVVGVRGYGLSQGGMGLLTLLDSHEKVRLVLGEPDEKEVGFRYEPWWYRRGSTIVLIVFNQEELVDINLALAFSSDVASPSGSSQPMP